MSKLANIELAQLKTAVHYFVGLLEEGSLVKNYDSATRDEIAEVLELMIEKVEGLPDEVPENFRLIFNWQVLIHLLITFIEWQNICSLATEILISRELFKFY